MFDVKGSGLSNAWAAEAPEVLFLLFSAATWSSQLIETFLPSEVEEERAAGSWRGTILCESLPAKTLEVVGVLGLRFISSSPLSSSSEKEEGSWDVCLESLPAERPLG